MANFQIEDLERYSFIMRTSRAIPAGTTVIRVRSIPENIVGEEIVIDVNGTHPETRTVTAKDTKYLTVAALTYAHEANVAVLRHSILNSYLTSALFDQALVINESGADVDFRIESDDNANMLFIDGGANKIGIGTATMAHMLNVAGSIGLDDGLGDSPRVYFIGGSNDDTASIYISNSATSEQSDLNIRMVGTTDEAKIIFTDKTGSAIQVSISAIGAVVFNEQGNDADFRVEGDTNANCLTLDAGNDNITINAAAVSAHYDLMLAGDGVLGLKESATPTADTDYGKVYAKNDNKLYFQDGAGTEHELYYFTQQTEITDELTTITYTAPTPDYAIQDLTTTTPYGFVDKEEGNTVLSVIANLQARVNELETALVALGLLADAD